MENTNNNNSDQKRIVVFSKDDMLLSVLVESLSQGMVCVHSYNAKLSDINFNNSVILLDYDAEDFNTTEMLPLLVKAAGTDNEVLVVSKNCERKIVADCAKKGATRFIVKPLNKKRFKKYVLPYLESTILNNSFSDATL